MPRCRGEREQSQARSTIRAPRQRASPGFRGTQSPCAVQKRGEAFWCFAGSLDFSSEDLSEEGTSALFGFAVGKAFISVKESVRGGFNWAAEGNRIRVAAAGKGSSPGDEGPSPRSRPAAGGDDHRSHLRAVPDRSWPSPASPSRGSNDGEDPHPDGGWQATPDGDHLGQVRGHNVGFHVDALLDPWFFPSETRFLRILSHLEPRAFSARGKQLWGIIEERVQTMARITTGGLNVQDVWSPVESPPKPSAVASLNSAVPSTASAVYRWACWNLGHGDDVKRFPWALPTSEGIVQPCFAP